MKRRRPYFGYDGIGVNEKNDLAQPNCFGIVRPRSEVPASFFVYFLDCEAKRLFLDVLATRFGSCRIRNRGFLRALEFQFIYVFFHP